MIISFIKRNWKPSLAFLETIERRNYSVNNVSTPKRALKEKELLTIDVYLFFANLNVDGNTTLHFAEGDTWCVRKIKTSAYL